VIELGWWPTLIVLGVAAAIFVWSRQVSLRPPDPHRPRLLNHGIVQLFSLIVAILMLVHVVTLVAGHPVTGQR
jgi:hypothetical protein